MAQPAFRGDRLLAARTAAGLSREDLTLQLGLSSPYRIRQWEMGFERPQPRFVPPLAAALKIDPLHLLDVDPADPPLAALRVAAGLSIAHVGMPTMSLMTFQRLEDGRPGGEPSAAVVAAMSEVLGLDPERIEAAIRRSRSDRAH